MYRSMVCCSACKRWHGILQSSILWKLCHALVPIVFILNCGTNVHDAAWNGDLQSVKSFIEKGGDVNVMMYGCNLLSSAAGSNNSELVKYLVSKGAMINQNQFKGITPLHYACREGRVENVRILLENGADPNALASDYKRSYSEGLQGAQSDPYEGTPFHYALYPEGTSENIKKQITALLLDHGGDPRKMWRTPNGYFKSPLSIAEGRNYIQIVILIRQSLKTDTIITGSPESK